MEKDLVLIVHEKVIMIDGRDIETDIITSTVTHDNDIESTLLGYVDIRFKDKFSDIPILKIIKDIFSLYHITFNCLDYKCNDVFSTISNWLDPKQQIIYLRYINDRLEDFKYVLVVKTYATNIGDGDMFSQIEAGRIGLYVYSVNNVYLNGKSASTKSVETPIDLADPTGVGDVKKPFEELEEHDNVFKILNHMINAAKILITVPTIPKDIFDTFKSLIDKRNRYITDNRLIDFHKFAFTKLIKATKREQCCSFCGELVSDPNHETIQISEIHPGCTLEEIFELIGYGVSIDRQRNTITIFSCDKHSEDLSKVAIAADTGKFSLNEILLRRFNPEIG